MADRKITQLSELVTGDDDTLITVVDLNETDPTLQNKKMKRSNLLKSAINAPTLNGVDSTTTARLVYGVNVISVSASDNFCTRLPATPVQGRAAVVINNSSFKARIFPSVTGGSINGVVDGYVDIPADKLPYAIYCYDNPDPGEWSVNAKKTANTITLADFTVSHTNGVAQAVVGLPTPINTFHGVALDGDGNMTVTPDPQYWRSENILATAVKMRVYTNIVANDSSSLFDPETNGISVYMTQAFKNASNGATSGTRAYVSFNKTGILDGVGGIVNGGILNTPAGIGDAGTFYAEVDLAPASGESNMIGIGGQYSRHYYTFGVDVGAPVVTKDFKFRIELDYI
jgi:hypothetical protein